MEGPAGYIIEGGMWGVEVGGIWRVEVDILSTSHHGP